MSETPRKRGRPKAAPDEKRDLTIAVRVTQAERELVAQAAGEEPVAVYARGVVLRAARAKTKRSRS